MDRLYSMEVFVKAVEAGSFSGAAALLDMSPQLVGKHVQMLEQHLGVRLLNRTTRRQHMTEFGERYYERVKEILADVSAAESLAEETRAVPRGKLRINAPMTFGISALAPRLQQYMAAHPEVLVDMSLVNNYVDIIETGADVVFRVGALPDSSMIARPLAPYRLVLCAAPSYLDSHPPIMHPADLSQHECLRYAIKELRDHWTFNGPDGEVVVPIHGRYLVDTGEALLPLAIAGFGIILQPIELVADALASGQLIKLLPDYTPPGRPFHLLYPADRRMTPKLRSFIDFVLQEFATDSWQTKCSVSS
jgi:DNA-binding transcriptional LysR family regulator